MFISFTMLFGVGIPEPGTEEPIKVDESSEMSVVLWGDPQLADYMADRHQYTKNAALDLANAEGTFDALVLAGDIAENGKGAEYQLVLNYLSVADDKIDNHISAVGNHDVRLRAYSQVVSTFKEFCNATNDNFADKAEFYNANGQLIATLTADGVAPALPEMAGYNGAEGWALYGSDDVIAAGADVKVEGTKVYVAKFGNPKPVKVNETEVAYGDKVSFKASPGIGQIFKCWKKDGVIVSTDETYEFFAWKDATVEAVYVTEEFTFSGIARKILIDTFATGGKSSVMAEFIGFGNNVVEKGIMFGDNRIAMTTTGNQFAVIADEQGTYKGYAIVENATDNGYSLITDGEYTK
jgi:hypothetical protein